MMIIFYIFLQISLQTQIAQEQNLQDSVIYSGWLKYFYYVIGDEAECDGPQHFEINSLYQQQLNNAQQSNTNYGDFAKKNIYNQEVYYNMNKQQNKIADEDYKDNKQQNNEINDKKINQKDHIQNRFQQILIDQQNRKQPFQKNNQFQQNSNFNNNMNNMDNNMNNNMNNNVDNNVDNNIPYNMNNNLNYNMNNNIPYNMNNNVHNNHFPNNQNNMNQNNMNQNNNFEFQHNSNYQNFQQMPLNPFNSQNLYYQQNLFNQQNPYYNQQNSLQNNQYNKQYDPLNYQNQQFQNNQMNQQYQPDINLLQKKFQQNTHQFNPTFSPQNQQNFQHQFQQQIQQQNVPYMKNGNNIQSFQQYQNMIPRFSFIQFDNDFDQKQSFSNTQDDKKISEFISSQQISIQIPNQNAFFFVLTNKTLYVLSSKQRDMTNTVRSLELTWLLPITYDQQGNPQGGLEEVGDFSEGYCFKIKSKTMAVWTICADNKQEKFQWMESIRLIVTDYNNMYGEQKSIQPIFQDPQKVQDGKWIIIQNFTQCSLACGGGVEFLQRVCQPPQNGGKKCEGETVIQRPCNSQPCPQIDQNIQPIVETKRVSNRPQRFEMCELREGDLSIFQADLNYPGRVILNNKTITLFNTAYSYDTVQKSFDLMYTIVKLTKENNPECFILQDSRDNTKEQKLCVLQGSVERNQTMQQFRDGWIKDITTFRDECQTIKRVDTLQDPEEQRLKSELLSQQNYNKMASIQDQKKEKRQIEESSEVDEAVKRQQEMVEKEMQYERLALQEESMREKEEEQNLRIQIQKEKEKEDSMVRFLQQKQKKIEVVDTTQESQNQIKLIEQNTKEELLKARSQVYQKIMSMRKAADRRRQVEFLIQQENRHQIEEIRSHIAQTVLSSEKRGNQTLCDVRQPQNVRFEYCDKSIPDEKPQLKSECHGTAQEFCLACCDNEFGLNFYQDRKDCYVNICNGQLDARNSGYWNWTPETSKVGSGSIMPVPQMINQFPQSISLNAGMASIRSINGQNILPPPTISAINKQTVDC